MFSLTKVLVPVDFSGRTPGVARYVRALARSFELELDLLHVVPLPDNAIETLQAGIPSIRDVFTEREKKMREKLETVLQGDLPGIPVRREVLQGEPARRISEYAHDRHTDLIVMPTHGYGPFRRFMLGSVTAKVLHDVECPVWTGVHLEEAPPPEEIEFRTVMAAVDLGWESAKALDWAAGFAERTGARLLLIHALPDLEGRSGDYFDPDWRQRIERDALEEIASLQKSVGTSAEVIARSGDAPKVVCGLAEERKADLLVIGRGSVAGVFGRLRANAYAIIRQSPCPVVSV
ncbi:MAG: universal stress protein [Bryobacteraceae bacterium]